VFLSLAVAAAVGLQVGAVLVPPLRGLLETEPLAARTWAIDVALAAVPGLLIWIGRRMFPLPRPATGRRG
jgi:hypothetical protein